MALIDARGHGTAQGVLIVHSCPRALAAHVTWALAKALGPDIAPEWSDQPITPGLVRMSLPWSGRPGTGARLASELQPFHVLRYEVTEDPSPGREGERFTCTPVLGLHRATIGVHGDYVVTEDRIRAAMVQASVSGTSLEEELHRVLGQAWDAELEPFRAASESAGSVRVLHHVV